MSDYKSIAWYQSEVARLTAALDDVLRIECAARGHIIDLQHQLAAAQQREAGLAETLRSVAIYHHHCCHAPSRTWNIDCPESTCVVARVHLSAAALADGGERE